MRFKRPLFSARFAVRLLTIWGVSTLGAMACGADPVDPEEPDDPEYNPGFMVGDWLADSLVMTSVANSEVVEYLVARGAVFTLSVQPSGRYTAILEGFGQSSSESGRLTVDGIYVILYPEIPLGSPSQALWERVGDSVILEGESEFDFNVDGTAEPATLRQVLIPN